MHEQENKGIIVQPCCPGVDQRKLGLLEKIVSYMDAHLTEKITLRLVAAHCGVSIATVTQLFQRKTGTTFHQYLTDQRMALARNLIKEGMPLEEVGRNVGYADHSTFYRAFRQSFGLSPREFRNQLMEESQ